MDRLKQVGAWLVRALLFLLILLFALKNAEPMTLRFYFGRSWDAPVALVLFVALAIGAALGLIAALQRIFAQRREILELKRELARRDDLASRTTAPAGAEVTVVPPGRDGTAAE
jgi:uncharacterized integral membrane protein